jgi:hypothetical protein
VVYKVLISFKAAVRDEAADIFNSPERVGVGDGVVEGVRVGEDDAVIEVGGVIVGVTGMEVAGAVVGLDGVDVVGVTEGVVDAVELEHPTNDNIKTRPKARDNINILLGFIYSPAKANFIQGGSNFDQFLASRIHASSPFQIREAAPFPAIPSIPGILGMPAVNLVPARPGFRYNSSREIGFP